MNSQRPKAYRSGVELRMDKDTGSHNGSVP
jgi:hypothetical protein